MTRRPHITKPRADGAQQQAPGGKPPEGPVAAHPVAPVVLPPETPAVPAPPQPTNGAVAQVQDGEQSLEQQPEAPLSPSEEVLGRVPGNLPEDGEYLNNAWVDKLPYLMERLGVPAGAKMKGPSFELELDDGRSFDLLLAAHRGIDFIQQALGQSGECMKAVAQMMQGLQQIQQQIAHLGGRIAECEKKLGIEPKLGPVPAPRGVIKKS